LVTTVLLYKKLDREHAQTIKGSCLVQGPEGHTVKQIISICAEILQYVDEGGRGEGVSEMILYHENIKTQEINVKIREEDEEVTRGACII
jgi:hypothetical protein